MDLEASINSADLRFDMIPMIEKVKPVADDMKQLREDVNKALSQGNLNANEIRSIDTALVGRDGNGGIFERFDKIEESQEKTQEMLQGIKSLFVDEIGKIDRRVEVNAQKIEAVGEKAAFAVTKIDEHIRETEKDEETNRKKWGARSWDLFKSILFVAIGFLVSML